MTDRDLRVTDNGDGTLTITVQTSAVFRYYDPEGKLLFVDAGNFRGQFMVDDGGTPTNPDDDTEIPDSFTVLKEVGSAQTAGRKSAKTSHSSPPEISQSARNRATGLGALPEMARRVATWLCPSPRAT